MSIDMADDAAGFIRESGGSLYIWVDDSGLLRSATSAPRHAEDWVRDAAKGVEVNVGGSAAEASVWHIRLRRFPWKRLDVTSDLTIGARGTSAPGLP